MPEDAKGTATPGAGVLPGPEGAAKPEADQVVMTKAEYEQALQVEADRRVTAAMKTAEKKWKTDYEGRVTAERADAERLATLTATEREKEVQARTRAELDAKEATLRKREMKLAAIDILAEEGLPVTFADQLLGDDADDTHARIKAFKVAWHKAIEAEVNERLKGVVPREGAEPGAKPTDMNKAIRDKAARH